MHGGLQAVPIISDPPGARVAIDSNPVGATPLVARVDRKENHLVTITRDGFPPVHVALERHLSAWVLGNTLIYWLPVIVDVQNGSAYAFPKDTIRARFTALSGSRADSSRNAIPIPRTRLTAESRATAAVYSLAIGFGSGHALMGVGAAGRPFRYTQLGAALTSAAGIGMDLGGQKGAGLVFWTGAVVFAGSRILEVGDVLTRREDPVVHVAPVADRDRVGAVLRIRF